MSWQWRMTQKLNKNWLAVFKLTWGTFDPKNFWKKFFLIGSLWPKYIMLELQMYRGVIFHDTEELMQILKKKLTCGLKNDMRNLVNFHQSTWKCQNWGFGGILLSKLEKVLPQHLQRSYVSRQWRIMQNLKRNWLVISKVTWGI